MTDRSLSPLKDDIASIQDPSDYFMGRRRISDPAPDNIILFARRRAEELWVSENNHFHHRWVLIAALEGKGILQVDRQSVQLNPGTFWLVPPLHLHGYSKVDPEILWLFITFEWPGHSAVGDTWSGPATIDRQAEDELKVIVSQYATGKGRWSVMAAHLHELLVDRYAKPAPRQRQQSSLLSRVKEKSLAKPACSISELANALGVSPSHLRAQFRAEAGISLGLYLRESRLREAAVSIKHEGLSVKAAAERAGYPNEFSFSRAFKRAMGNSPSELKPK
jgi:AraC-like DNA-binding protein/mannose-6-phosphate isomerase-like protein (cupin superfamily)